MTLEDLIRRAKVWRAGEVPSESGLATGFPLLDAMLPGHGWPRAALTEILTDHPGIGALRLVLPALASLTRDERWLIWVAPPHIPYAPALERLGVELTRLLIVDTETPAVNDSEQMLWVFEQALRFSGCGAALAWVETIDQLRLRRLQLACEAGGSWGVMFRPLRFSQQASPASLRLSLLPGDSGSVHVNILKCRGRLRAQRCELVL